MPQPPQLQRTSENIGEELNAIRTGKSRGKYKALDALLSPPYSSDSLLTVDYAHTICTPECPNRRMIQDVTPPTGERLAVVEHRVNEIDKEFDRHREESIRASALYATKEELSAVKEHVSKLDTQSTLKSLALIFTIIGFLISMSYNIVNIYKVLHL